VVEVLRAAELIDRPEVVLQRFGHVVEEEVLVDRTVGPALGAGAVVANDHDDCVVQLAERARKSSNRPIW
jgi:hypothetical protein